MTVVPGYCPHCLHAVEFVWPVEPLFTADTAAMLVPTSSGALKKLLTRHKPFLPHYRLWEHRRVRYISASEIRWVRERLFHHAILFRKAVSPSTPHPAA